MTDDAEIAALLHRYAELVDDGDFLGVGDLFAHAVLSVEGSPAVCQGREAAHRMYDTRLRLYSDGTPRTQHIITNVVVDVADDRATATSRSYYMVLQATDALALQPIIAGRYHDRFERVDNSWRFTHRHMVRKLVGNLDEHLLVELGADIA